MAQTERPSAEHGHPDVFRHLDAIVLQVHEWLHGNPIPTASTALDNLKVAFIVRALNQYRAIVLLLKSNHWEDGLILTRAPFELLLNVEELVHRAKDKEDAARRFFLFSYLQELLEKLGPPPLQCLLRSATRRVREGTRCHRKVGSEVLRPIRVH